MLRYGCRVSWAVRVSECVEVMVIGDVVSICGGVECSVSGKRHVL